MRLRRANSICCGSGRREQAEVGEPLEQPVVERPLILEFQRAQRVRDVLQRVGLAVREVVHRIDAPLVAGAVVMRMADAVDHRVAQVDVGRGHVDLAPQHVRAVGKLAVAHAAEEIEVLRDGPVAPGRILAGLGQRAAELAHLVGAQLVDVGQAVLDERLGEPYMKSK